jgi:hypothetical protein
MDNRLISRGIEPRSQFYDFWFYNYNYNDSFIIDYSVFRIRIFIFKTDLATLGVVNFYSADIVTPIRRIGSRMDV